MKLYCDNIDDFINSVCTHYSVVDRRYRKGQTVKLYNHEKEHDFKIMYVLHYPEHWVLHLMPVEKANKINTFYAGYNIND